MPGGGTCPGEEVRDGPHNNNRCGGNRGGVARTAAPLRPPAGTLRGSGLYTGLGRAFRTPLGAALRFAPSKRCAGASVVRTYLAPVGRAQHHTDTTSSVLGASASIMGRSSQATGLRPFALPFAQWGSVGLALPLPPPCWYQSTPPP